LVDGLALLGYAPVAARSFVETLGTNRERWAVPAARARRGTAVSVLEALDFIAIPLVFITEIESSLVGSAVNVGASILRGTGAYILFLRGRMTEHNHHD
jgi:hypothetical protein